jgi:translation initiation factor IF-2
VKSEVKEMSAGQECGVSSTRFNDFQVGDILQSVVLEQIKRNIDDAKKERTVVGPPAPRR